MVFFEISMGGSVMHLIRLLCLLLSSVGLMNTITNLLLFLSRSNSILISWSESTSEPGIMALSLIASIAITRLVVVSISMYTCSGIYCGHFCVRNLLSTIRANINYLVLNRWYTWYKIYIWYLLNSQSFGPKRFFVHHVW